MICSVAGVTVAAVFASLFSLLNFDFLCHVTLYAGSFINKTREVVDCHLCVKLGVLDQFKQSNDRLHTLMTTSIAA